MRIKLDKLRATLKQQLSPIYLLSGQEPLLCQEAFDLIKKAARSQGYDGFESVEAKSQKDFELLETSIHTPSLFEDKKLIEVKLTAKINKKISEQIRGLAASSHDTVLVFRVEKLDSRTLNSAWVKAIDKVGVILTLYPISPDNLPAWLKTRSQAKGITLSDSAVKVLAEFVQGNLIAADQELEKLAILYPDQTIDQEAIMEACHDSARFNIFELVDCGLKGEPHSCLKILDNLKKEGEQPILILWALSKQIRELAGLAHEQATGIPVNQVLAKPHIWQQRKTLLSRALQRHSVNYWQSLLKLAQYIDCQLKGIKPGNPWDSLLILTLKLGGITHPPKPQRAAK